MLVFLAIALLEPPGVDSLPVRPISQLVHTTWTAKDGAPSETRALAQTSDGYLWLGTAAGLVRFDGVRFVPFAPINGDTLEGGGIRTLLGTRDGSLWITWSNGRVSQLRGGRVRSYGERDGLAVTYQVVESSTGNLVAGTARGLARFTDGKWKDVNREWGYPGTECKALWFDRDDALWAETADRVVYLPLGSHRFLDPGNRLRNGSALARFAQEKDGTIWMAEVFRAAHTLWRTGDRHTVTEVAVGTWTLLIDRKGSLWIGSAGDGLRRVLNPSTIRGKEIAQFGAEAEQFTEKDGLLSNLIDAMMEDREGNIWIANSRGIERFREGAFSPLPTPGSIRPRSVYATNDTAVWTAAFAVPGLQRVSARGIESFQSEFFHFAPTLFQDASGKLWTVGDSLILQFQEKRGGFFPIRLRKSNANNLVDLTVDTAGNVWVFDQGLGLLRLDGDSLVQMAQLYDPAFPYGKLFSDRKGRIWVGQQHRVVIYDHGKQTIIGSGQGLKNGGIFAFFEDRGGNIWGAGDGGVGRFEGGRFRALPERPDLPVRSAYGIAEDNEGAWWIITRTNVVRLPAGEADRAIADSGYDMRYHTFDNLDGLPGMISVGNFSSMLTRTPDGRIWVGTDSGIASVDPGHLPAAMVPPVVIEAVRIDGRERRPSDAAAVPPRSRDIEIDYTATSLALPERTRFRYRLEGVDPAWRDVGTRRRAYYNGLAPGTYRFRVIASNADGVWNETGAAWSFRVLPAWYQTLWFKAGVVLLIGGLGAAGAALVQRSRHQRAQATLKGQYEATIAERARIAQDLHDTLLQGFAGVTLQLKAAELALPDQPQVAAETINRVRQLARESLREARERVWEMRDPALAGDDLPAALEAMARDRTAGTGIAIALRVIGSRRRVARPLEEVALRIGREAVVNVIKHAGANHLDIEVTFGESRLGLEVRDDGRGFTPEESEDARRRGHFGLSGIRERAIQAGGRAEVRASPGGGTIVGIELPLEESRLQQGTGV
ncbi:MAG: two-component regulator propeller domain-containing protein [Gemmatimonadota bacterium]